jgi:hypothetical protein
MVMIEYFGTSLGSWAVNGESKLNPAIGGNRSPQLKNFSEIPL